MIKRKNHPYIRSWALPGGFVEIDESIDEAAKRELEEETGIRDIYMEQLYTWGDVKRDPRSRVISCSYMALVKNKDLNVRAGDDAADAAWFDVEYKIIDEKVKKSTNGYQKLKNYRIKLSNEEAILEADIIHTETIINSLKSVKVDLNRAENIAFDHGIIIQHAIEKLRHKVENTDLVFNLVDEKFSLKQLQRVYEIILDKTFYPAIFRKRMGEKVLATNEFIKDSGYRPSQLYKYNFPYNKK